MMPVTSSPPGVLTSERINVRPTEHRFPSLHFLWCVRILHFQWPMLCTVSKTSHGRVHRKTNITSPFFSCFVAWWRLMWFCEGDCICYVWTKLDFAIHCVRYCVSRPVNKQMFGGISSAWARQRKKKKSFQQAIFSSVVCGRICSLNYYTSAAAFNKEWLKLGAW